jgi:hypothetical protein
MDTNKSVTANFNHDIAVNEEILTNQINVYPNPTTNIFNIKVANGLEVKQVLISNIEGKVIQINYNTNQISLQDCENGLYFIQIETNNGIAIKRIVKL